MTARELINILQKMPKENLELPICYVDGAYLGSVTQVQRVEINLLSSIAGPAMIVLK